MNRFWCILGAFIVLSALTPAASGQFHFGYSRWFRDAGPAFQGNLTWNDGAGGIAWVGGESQDDVRIDDASPEVQTARGTLQYATGADVDGKSSRTFVFRSAPLQEAAVLNVTRPIQLEVFLYDPEKYACQYIGGEPAIEVDLRADGKRLAGTSVNWQTQWSIMYHRFGYSGSGVGSYSQCFLGMGAEAAVLPAGTVLELKVTFHAWQRAYALGLRDDHRSTLKLPLLPDEEILFRYPELAPTESEEEMDGADIGAFAWVPGMAALLGLAARSRGARVVAVMVVFLLVTLAGCVDKAKERDPETSARLTGDVQNTLRRGTGEFASDEVGSIVGQVRDDMHIPVAGVHISILGTSDFAQSDSKGRFKFAGLLPGLYKLRFDRKEYLSFETTLEVKAGFVSRPDVTLFLSNPKDRDFRPHSHDYWPTGQTVKPLLDHVMRATCLALENGCFIPHHFQIPPKAGETNTILPGTSEVVVILDWDPAALGQQRLGLAVQHNADDGSSNYTFFGPRGPREPFRIATSWEMTDAGHQDVSTWTFLWYESDPHPQGLGGVYAAAFTGLSAEPPRGAVHAKVSIQKGGLLPLEPPHPDRWGTLNKIESVKNSQGYYSTCLYPKPAMPDHYCTSAERVVWTPTKLTPPGASHVDVTLTLKRDTQPLYGFKLLYRPANAPPPSDVYSLERHQEAPAPTETGLTYKWRIPIKPEETDFIYARKTRWQFALVPSDENLGWADNNLAMSFVNLARGSQSYTLNAVVHKGS